MPNLDSNIPSNIYDARIGSEILRFARINSDINTFTTLSNRLLKRMKKQGRKHRSIISMLNKIFGKQFAIINIFADAVANFSKFFH